MGERKRAARRRRYAIAYRVTIALIIFVGVIVKGLVEGKVWTTPPAWILPGVVFVVGAAALRDSVVSAIAKFTAPGRHERATNMRMALVAAMAEIAEHRGVSMTDLGANVFVVNKGPRWLPPKLRERWGWSRPHLERILRIRLTDNPQPSDVRWFKGKGTIGRCWALDKVQYMYWLPIAEKHGEGDLSDTAFKKLSATTRMEMTKQEFCSIAGKYAEILAVPLKESDGQCVGVVSVDLARKNRRMDQGRALNTNDVEEFVTQAAAFVSKNR